MPKSTIKPQPGPQTRFLQIQPDLCIYGGAAGGGKSFSVLLTVYIHAHNDPLYRAVVFRRTMPMITQPGSLWDAAKKLYTPIEPGIRFMEKDKKILFPNGAIVQFSHMERITDYLNWQGAELTGVFFEEATHFEEVQVEYLFSRMRSDSPRDSYMKMTCNPDSTSFLRRWLVSGGYVDDETGFAIPEMSGVIRWFVRRNGNMIWGDSPQELADKLNDPEIVDENEAMSFSFICSKLSDNPKMTENNPRYKASLKGLSVGKRRALLEGNWNFTQGAKELFDRDWVNESTNRPDDFKKVVRYWDRAGTEPNEKNRNPDWTVGLLMGVRFDLNRNPEFWILDVIRFRETPAKVKQKIIKAGLQDQAVYGSKYHIVLEQDPGQAGKAEAETLKNDLLHPKVGIKKVACRAVTKAKRTRYMPFSTRCEEGKVFVIRAKWNDDFYNENEVFTGELATTPKGAKDDQVDCAGGAINELIGIGGLGKLNIGGTQGSRFTSPGLRPLFK